ncbi:G-X-X-X-Q-X-W domain-containing protein [Ephemerocybe angulata]|uniref:G-X-X-X-Q-X-W domain-containing protein n=1 Tax=Ephemerocybe angulata TaxID=980116 RepID=A0A8H6IA55_9AGAR|nr:G-X-X-X-Q-X-W domain-containing protein [Tulosesus angulatus]
MLLTILPVVLLSLSSVSLASALNERRQATDPGFATQFIIHNSCPATINVYVGSSLDSSIQSGGNHTRFGYTTDLFYTDANGGSANGAGSTKAGFSDRGYYYMVKNGNGPLNTGLSVVPRSDPHSGFCIPIECNSPNCDTAFDTPPATFPPIQYWTPPTPYYMCQYPNTTYDITFCPTGAWPVTPPAPTSSKIHPGSSGQKCLDVRGAKFENGTPVQIYDCNGTAAQNWQLVKGSTKVKLAGTNFCLDAGSSPGNGIGLKIWQCYDNLPAQQWYFTGDNRIALEGKGQCLDLPNGALSNSNQVQTWQCTTGNSNQVWTI